MYFVRRCGLMFLKLMLKNICNDINTFFEKYMKYSTLCKYFNEFGNGIILTIYQRYSELRNEWMSNSEFIQINPRDPLYQSEWISHSAEKYKDFLFVCNSDQVLFPKIMNSKAGVEFTSIRINLVTSQINSY